MNTYGFIWKLFCLALLILPSGANADKSPTEWEITVGISQWNHLGGCWWGMAFGLSAAFSLLFHDSVDLRARVHLEKSVVSDGITLGAGMETTYVFKVKQWRPAIGAVTSVVSGDCTGLSCAVPPDLEASGAEDPYAPIGFPKFYWGLVASPLAFKWRDNYFCIARTSVETHFDSAFAFFQVNVDLFAWTFTNPNETD